MYFMFMHGRSRIVTCKSLNCQQFLYAILYSKIRVVGAFAMIMESPATEFVLPGIVIIRVFPEKIGWNPHLFTSSMAVVIVGRLCPINSYKNVTKTSRLCGKIGSRSGAKARLHR